MTDFSLTFIKKVFGWQAESSHEFWHIDDFTASPTTCILAEAFGCGKCECLPLCQHGHKELTHH